MNLKQLVHNEKEYWDFVFPLVSWAEDNTQSLWREEDYPKLQPFFDAQHKEGWSEEAKQSFEFYKKCLEDYANRNTELRDATRQFTAEEILNTFGYKLPDDEEEEFTKDHPLPLTDDFTPTFPFIVVGEINSGFDRLGNVKILMIYFVSKKEFDNATT